MTGDPVKSVPLPSGPASLCFDKDEFMKVKYLKCLEINVNVLTGPKSYTFTA